MIVNGIFSEVDEKGGGIIFVRLLKGAVEKSTGISCEKQRLFVGLLDMTKCGGSDFFGRETHGEIHVVDDEHMSLIPKYNVLVTDFFGVSMVVELQPSPDITQLKAQLVKNMGLDVTDTSKFEAVSKRFGVLDDWKMKGFQPCDTLRLLHNQFNVKCTVERKDTGEMQCMDVNVNIEDSLYDLVKRFDLPMGEYKVTVDGKPCNDWCRTLAWCAGARSGSSIYVEVYPSPGFQIFIKTLTEKIFTFVVHGSWTNGILKSRIREKEGIPCDQQQIIIRGMTLRTEDILEDCGVKDGSTLHLVLRLR